MNYAIFGNINIFDCSIKYVKENFQETITKLLKIGLIIKENKNLMKILKFNKIYIFSIFLILKISFCFFDN